MTAGRFSFASSLGALLCVIAARLMTAAASEPPEKVNRSEGSGVESLPFDVKLDVVHRELSRNFCWFHPRVAAIPGAGRDGSPAVVMTLQKHLTASDHYSGMYFMRTDDLGKTWSGPTAVPALDWRKESDDVTIAVCDITPGWHAPTGRLLAIGIKLRYGKNGEQLEDKPRSLECAYATYDPKNNRWTPWRMLDMPDTDKFFLVCPGCVQWLVKPDGRLLVPTYYRPAKGGPYSTTVLECEFDGTTMKYLRHGDEIALDNARGVYEPSLCSFAGKYYLTLRNDNHGYVTTSDDGLHYRPAQPWTFDDGSDLGSYNTQQHWLTHSDGLYLAYTRRGAKNDHIVRHRAPLFLARVDPETLRVVRSTEQLLIPQRGVMLGNFGAAAITPGESWVTDAEFIFADKPHAKGADGSTFAARVIWSRPNKLTQRTD